MKTVDEPLYVIRSVMIFQHYWNEIMMDFPNSVSKIKYCDNYRELFYSSFCLLSATIVACVRTYLIV